MIKVEGDNRFLINQRKDGKLGFICMELIMQVKVKKTKLKNSELQNF